MNDSYRVEEIGSALREIHSYLRKDARATTEHRDLSGPRFAILMILKHYQPMKVSELQEKLHVAMSTVTQMADSLDTSGYIERCRTDEDRRVVLLNLTKKGEALVEELKERHLRYLTNALSDFDERQRDELFSSLMKLSTSLHNCATAPEEVIDG